MLTPTGAMKLAIEEGRKGLGLVAPNPPVGCVILDSRGDLLAKGHHRVFGGGHAEIEALKQIPDQKRLDGATMYVTLEPCAHEGKTPSCAKFLATLPIKKIVYGVLDPHPLVAGQGLDILRKANIEVEEFSRFKDEAEELAEVFLWNHRFQKTFVALKVATSLDGQLAHITGESKWITGAESREHTHFLRANYDAVLVGVETFRKDNPSLNIRHPRFVGKRNKVIILGAYKGISEDLRGSQIAKTHSFEDVYVATPENWDEESDGWTWLKCRTLHDGRIDLTSLLRKVYEVGIGSLFVEGGARVISSFLQAGYVQRYYQFIAPQIIGAKSGISFTRDFFVDSLPDKRELRNPQTHSFGADLMITGRLD